MAALSKTSRVAKLPWLPSGKASPLIGEFEVDIPSQLCTTATVQIKVFRLFLDALERTRVAKDPGLNQIKLLEIQRTIWGVF